MAPARTSAPATSRMLQLGEHDARLTGRGGLASASHVLVEPVSNRTSTVCGSGVTAPPGVLGDPPGIEQLDGFRQAVTAGPARRPRPRPARAVHARARTVRRGRAAAGSRAPPGCSAPSASSASSVSCGAVIAAQAATAGAHGLAARQHAREVERCVYATNAAMATPKATRAAEPAPVSAKYAAVWRRRSSCRGPRSRSAGRRRARRSPPAATPWARARPRHRAASQRLAAAELVPDRVDVACDRAAAQDNASHSRSTAGSRPTKGMSRPAAPNREQGLAHVDDHHASANFQPCVRSALVPPALPLPSSRMSTPRNRP